MLNEKNIEFEYREYKKNPLSEDELRDMLKKLEQPAHTLLRKRDKAYKENALTGSESDEELLPLFAAHPTLMNRPIFLYQNKAILCRPYDRLEELL